MSADSSPPASSHETRSPRTTIVNRIIQTLMSGARRDDAQSLRPSTGKAISRTSARRAPAARSASRWREALVWGGLCALIVFAFRGAFRAELIENAAYDLAFQLRGTRQPSPQIVILVADDASVTRHGGWPLRRGIWARVVRRLDQLGAQTIAFDILFPSLSKNIRDDADLVQACRDSGNVVHAAVLHLQRLPVQSRQGIERLRPMPAEFRLFNGGAPAQSAIAGATAHPDLLRDAAGIGNITVFPELDGTLRRIPTLIRYRGDSLYPSLALAAAAHQLRVPQEKILAMRREDDPTQGTVCLNGRCMPTNENGETLINWAGPSLAIPTFSINDLLDDRVTRQMIEGKVVVVGTTAAGAFERINTPFSPLQPAVELQANAVNDILSNRFLHEIAPLWQLALLFGFPVLVVLVVWECDAKSGFWRWLMISLVLWGGATALFAVKDLYFPVAFPLLAGMMAGGSSVGRRQMREARALREAEERFALAVRGANDGVWDWDLVDGGIFYSPRWKEMLGYSEEEIGTGLDEWMSRVHPADTPLLQAALEAHRSGEHPHFECEYRMTDKNGETRWMLSRGLLVRDEAGRPTRMAGSQTDVTARKNAERELEHNAFYDALTGLPNRALFAHQLQTAIDRTHRNPGARFAVLFLDLDRFKNINDSLGHVQGDHLLIEVARRLSRCLRPGDVAARLGGDEFTILLEEISDLSDATHIAMRLQEELARPFDLDGHELSPSASIGIALSRLASDPSGSVLVEEQRDSGIYVSPEDVLRDADTAMYRAKARGNGQYAVFDEAMHARAVAILRAETDLRRAVPQEFEVFYQAIVSLQTGRIAGFEALSRWRHPQNGLVPPSHFIPIAEETGLIVALDEWSLRQACCQTLQWQQRFPRPAVIDEAGEPTEELWISVNLSGRCFSHGNLLAQIMNTLHTCGFSPASLKLEITESVLIDNVEATVNLLAQIRATGVRLSLDDFGTGYSSLSYLHRFPLDTLKIDRSFITRLGEEGEEGKIVRAIITLAQGLGLQVIAEGVETAEQLALLRALGCDYGQGYWFSRPLDADAASALLAADPQF